MTIDSVTPQGANLNATVAISIVGTGFVSGLAASIDGVGCTSIVFVNSTLVTAVCPASAVQKVGSLVLTNPDLSTANIPFYYMASVPGQAAEKPVNAKFTVEAIPISE